MATKLTRLTHKMAIQLHLVAESYTICSSRSRCQVLKLVDTPSYEAGWNWMPSFLYGELNNETKCKVVLLLRFTDWQAHWAILTVSYVFKLGILLDISVRLLGWGMGPLQALYRHRNCTTQKNCRNISMFQAGFKPTILVFEQSKTISPMDW
jgi:hypothetical protein